MSEIVLVTGGSGFIAQWCIHELLTRGFIVRATVRNLARVQSMRAALGANSDRSERLSFVAATLEEDSGWAEAVKGCAYVLHIASPFPAESPKDENALIIPAREGTLRVLRHSVAAQVKRVVLTSSSAAMAYANDAGESKIIDESCWTDISNSHVTPYTKSKVIAERAAWDFMAKQGGGTTLTTIAPGTVIGPLLDRRASYSVQSISRLLDGSAPAVPNFGFSYVDVRDIADLHVRAMTAPDAAGLRILGAGTFLWYADVARTLREQLGSSARKVPKRVLPNGLVRLLALFDRSLRPILPELGVKRAYSANVAQRVLNWSPRPVTQSIIDCANSLFTQGIVK
jgi:nucleoside-diphosphate-sugar epimerase